MATDFTVKQQRDALVVTGAIDAACASQFEVAMRDWLARTEVRVIDLAGLTFLDSNGLSVLVRAAADSADTDTTLVLRGMPPALVRLVELTGVRDLFEIQT